MAKQYGLIVPKNKSLTGRSSVHAAFNNDSDSEDSTMPVTHTTIKRQDRLIQEKAVEEDPTVYQYDELYDEMDQKRKESKLSRKDLDKKPKYINKLLATAERRKKENERRIERQIQKEREEEGETFKDKESFVTSAYRQKLEEMKELEAQEAREEYLESIGDVKKQGNLDGFYRHLYDQKVNYEDRIKKEDENNESQQEQAKEEENESQQQEIKKEISTKKQSTRKYRKRDSSNQEEETAEEETKLEHLPSNLDADSDFSIDSSDSEDDAEKKRKEKTTETVTIAETKKTQIEPKIEVKKEEKKAEVNEKEVVVEIKPKKPKIDIWKKRTVGEVFEQARERYLERKRMRNL